jgi:hypothetical protein
MFFEHVLQLHLAYHRRSHSGRLLKIMLQGAEQLFGLWVTNRGPALHEKAGSPDRELTAIK